MADREVKQWITVNGKHVPIFEGESKAAAIKRAADKQINDDADKKEKQIAENKKKADMLNDQKKSETTEKDDYSWMSNYSNLGIAKHDTKDAIKFTTTKSGKYGTKVDDYKKLAATLNSGDYKKVAIQDSKGRTHVYISKDEDGIFVAEYIARKGDFRGSYGNAITEKKKLKTARGVADFVASYYSLGKYERDAEGYYQRSKRDEYKKKKNVWLL